jgi:hypothetical protein
MMLREGWGTRVLCMTSEKSNSKNNRGSFAALRMTNLVVLPESAMPALLTPLL